MAKLEQPYDIKPAHDSLYVNLRGSWGADVMAAFTKDYKQLVGRYFAREWACVLNISKLELLIGEQEQIAAFRALQTWSFIKGLRALAVVVSDNNPSYLLYQFEEVLKGKNSFDHTVVYSEREAEYWLRQLGFSEKLELQSQKSA